MRVRVIDARPSYAYGNPFYLTEADIESVDSCPVCRSDSEQTILGLSEAKCGTGLSVSHCASCNHAYLSRRPTSSWYQRYYAEVWDSGQLDLAPSVNRIRHLLKKTPRLRELARALKNAWRYPRTEIAREQRLAMFAGLGPLSEGLSHYPKGAKILEIGSGYGGAMDLFQDAGFKAYGTEASRHRVEFCRSQGLNVYQTNIDELDAVARYAPFDFVYSSHVFEHLLDLRAMMETLTPLVNDQGALYIEVPHGPVIENIIHLTHIPVHCHAFSGKSLARLVEDFGFTAVRLMVDMNLHLVASKGLRGFSFPAVEIPGTPKSYREQALPVVGDDPIEFTYDHFYVNVSDARNQQLLYERSSPYAISRVYKPGTTELVNQFTLSVEGSNEEGEWPIRFIHDSDLPPVWAKRQ